MRPSQTAIDIISKWEGYHTKQPDGSCKAYLDKLVRPALRSKGYPGLWTIGYGSTGRHVTEGTHWTHGEALAELKKVVDRHGDVVNKHIKVSLNQNQFDALTSLSYNMGLHKAKTLIKHVNNKDFDKARKAFALYNKAGGKVVRGLVNRRKDEAELFARPGRKEIVESSRKLTFLQRLRLIIVSLGIPGYITWENVAEARDFLNDHAGVIVLGIGVLVWVGSKLLEKWSMQDFERGDWVPSGLADKETV